MRLVEAVGAGAGIGLISAAAGAGVGVLEVFLFYHPGRRHGPTARIHQAMSIGTLVLLVGVFWSQALGLLSADPGTEPVDHSVSVPLAVGFTLGSGWLGLRRWRRYRRMLRSELGSAQKPGTGSAVTGSPAAASGAQPAPIPVWRRALRLAFRSLDYVMGVAFCWMAIIGAALVSDGVRARSGTWFSGHAHMLALVGTHAVLLVAGFMYSQLVSGVARKAMSVALARDWHVSRSLHYALLAPPFVLALPAAVAYPGLLTGILVQLATLYAGWRWTTERPGTALGTARLVRERLRLPRGGGDRPSVIPSEA